MARAWPPTWNISLGTTCMFVAPWNNFFHRIMRVSVRVSTVPTRMLTLRLFPTDVPDFSAGAGDAVRETQAQDGSG